MTLLQKVRQNSYIHQMYINYKSIATKKWKKKDITFKDTPQQVISETLLLLGGVAGAIVGILMLKISI